MDHPTFGLMDEKRVFITHLCNHEGLGPDGSVQAHLPVGGNGWTVVSEHPLTVTPSILCMECGFHGFITDGVWVPC